MKKALLGLSATVVVLACAAALYGLAWELPNEGPVTVDWKLPPGVTELASSRNRVHGFMSTFGYADLWYAGDAKAFNAYLAEYARLKDLPLQLVIHPAPGSSLRQYVSQPRAHYDWELSVKWDVALREDPKDDKAEGRAVTTLRPEGFVVTLHLFLSDAVTLDDIVVPANVEVKSGGEIEQFVAKHGAAKAKP
jgi:hypothetical protein